MIITCQKCSTRFQLDDGRIPLAGVKVRCSRCKHAFFVKPADAEGASDREAAEALAFDAAAGDRTQILGEPAPDDRTQALDAEMAEERTRVLGDPLGEEAPRTLDGIPDGAPAPLEAEEESDWEFNEDFPEPERDDASPLADPGSLLGGPERDDPAAQQDPMGDFLAAASEPEPAAERASLDDVGDPREWDLLGEGAGAHGPAQAPDPADRRVEAAGPEEAAAAEALPVPVHAEPVEDPIALREGGTPARALASAAAWLGVALGLALVAWQSLVPGASSRVPGASGPAAKVGALRAEEVRGRLVENAAGGSLFVVSGSLRNPGDGLARPGAPLLVRLVGADGTPLPDGRAIVAPAASEAQLRSAPPEALAAHQLEGGAVLADLALGPGEAIRFTAVFAELPSGARAFRFEIGEGLSPEALPPTPPPSSE